MEFLEILDIISERHMIGFGGEWGRRKSLSITAMAYFLAKKYQKRHILTNMPVKLPIQKTTYDALVETSQLDQICSDSIIIIDEFQEIDSRDSMNAKNRFVTNFAKSLRKLDSILLFSVQYFDFIDTRANDLTAVKIIPTSKHVFSKNERQNNLICVKNKDFLTEWDIFDMKSSNRYITQINLYPFINMYLHDFMPESLAITHADYIFHLQTQRISQKSMREYQEAQDNKIKNSLENWNEENERLNTIEFKL